MAAKEGHSLGPMTRRELSPKLLAVVAGLLAGCAAGLAGGMLWGPTPAEVAADGTVIPADWSGSWPGLAIGFALGGLGVFAVARLAQSAGALSMLADARERAGRAGLGLKFDQPSLFRPEAVEADLADLVEQAVFQAQTAKKDKDKFQDALGRYNDPTLTSRLKESTSIQAVGTQKLRCAVLFCDIRGFTKMSETLKVEEVVYVLNDYFTVGSKAISDQNGQINKFIGDAILAVFQDPPGFMTGSQACRNAVTAGQELVATFRRQSGLWRNKIQTPFEVDLGVGVHYGELIMGNFGSPQRMEYTVIGDTVNFASRLCSLAQKGQVRLSQECWSNVESYFSASPMEPVHVKGKSGEYQTYLLSGKKQGT